MAPKFSDHFLPDVTVDVVLFSVGADGLLQTLVTQRSGEPFAGLHALPGVFVGRNESLDQAARRALKDKGGLTNVFLEQLFTSGEPARDPRGRVVSVAYFALVPTARLQLCVATVSGAVVAPIVVPWPGEKGGSIHALDARGKTLKLAFDHGEIIGGAVKRIRGKLNYAPIGFELLPETFTLLELQRIHEAILGRKLNKDSFRRRMLGSGFIEDTKKRQANTTHRPAALYRLKKGKRDHG